MREHMEKHIRAALDLLMQLNVNGRNVKPLAMAEQHLEDALGISAKMAQAEKAKADAAKPAEEAAHE